MQAAEVLEALQKYKVELATILGRFTRTRERISIDSQDNYRLRTITTELVDLLRDHVPGSAQHIRLVTNSYNDGISNFYNSSSYASVEEIRGVVCAVITRIERNPTLFTVATGSIESGTDQRRLLDALDELVLRFHAVAVQLRSRHAERPTLDVNDEYDVQDLMHALLRLHFNDVRPEEWVPSYAGSASRTDFLLPEIDTVIEIKKTRSGLNAKSVGEQLIIDIAKYKKHPQCRRLVCFVYDPEGRVANPAGIESDLNTGDHGIEVRVSILPKASA
ncbi:hypothetical protein [Rhodoferax sp. WC2427]|uniref:PD-(D/E)XK nuclease domain-containing protein n=1 Tax=Rhodoferax sp. WC2427 TaxID=3234144 RepID=UPI003466BAEC